MHKNILTQSWTRSWTDNPGLLFFFVISATLFIIRTNQAALSATLLLDSPFSSKPIYKSSHRLRPPRLFIFISSAKTANGKIKIQRIIICYLQASAIHFLLTSSIYIPTCTLKTPAHKKRGKGKSCRCFYRQPSSFILFL